MSELRVIIQSIWAALLLPGIAGIAIPIFLKQRLAAPFGLNAPLFVGGLVLAAGSVLYIISAWRFVYCYRQRPLPFDEPDQLAVDGVYGRVRHPVYAAVLVLILGQGLLADSAAILGYAGLLWTAFYFLVDGYEEPCQKKRYGDSYQRYRERVPRWIPRVHLTSPIERYGGVEQRSGERQYYDALHRSGMIHGYETLADYDEMDANLEE